MCLLRTPCHRGKNTRHDLSCRRAGATPRTFWAAESRKSGVAPARFGVFSTVTFSFLVFVSVRSLKTSDLFSVKKLAAAKVHTVILTYVTRISLNQRFEAPSALTQTFQCRLYARGHLFRPAAGCRLR